MFARNLYRRKQIAPVVGAAIAGGLISGAFGQSSANKSMEFQKQSAQNRHQWEVADLKKAGLNPILSAGGTPGTLSGAQATMPDMGAIVSSAVQSSRVKHDIKNVEATNNLIRQQTQNVFADTTKKMEEADLTKTQNTLQKAQIPGAVIEAEIDSGMYGEALRYINRLSSGSSATDIGRSIITRGRTRKKSGKYSNPTPGGR